MILLLAFITLNTNANQIDTLINRSSAIVDSTKKTVKESISIIDTSSNFTMIYKDIKNGISALALGLKVGTEHVYTILVKQQVVNSIIWLIYLIICIPLGFILYKIGVHLFKICDKNDNPLPIAYSFFIGVSYFLILISCFCHLDIIIMGFVNPEYGAINEILHFVSKYK